MKRERFIFLIVFLALVSFALSSCGQKQADTGDKAKEQPKQVYNLKMNVIYPPPTYDWEAKKIATEVFAKRVEEATKGQVKIQFFYNSQLSPVPQGLDAIRKGVADLWSGSSTWGGTIPESDVIWLPFGFRGAEHAMHVMRETEVGKIFDEAYKKQGAHVLMYWPSGGMVFISKKPVRSVDDVRGLKLRFSYAIWKSWYKRMDASPVNLAVAEQYEGLMRGTADATIYPDYTITTYKFDEVCKYVTEPAIVDPGLCYVLINNEKWNSLPADVRKAIEKVVAETEKETIAATKKLTEYALDNAVKKGVQIIKLNRKEFDRFKESAMPAWEEFAAKSPECAQMVKVLKEDIKKWEETRPEAKEWYDKWLSK